MTETATTENTIDNKQTKNTDRNAFTPALNVENSKSQKIGMDQQLV